MTRLTIEQIRAINANKFAVNLPFKGVFPSGNTLNIRKEGEVINFPSSISNFGSIGGITFVATTSLMDSITKVGLDQLISLSRIGHIYVNCVPKGAKKVTYLV